MSDDAPMPRALAWARIGGLVAGVGVLFGLVALTGDLSADRVRDTVASLGVAAPLAFVLVAALLTVAMFPLLPIAVASGVLFTTSGGSATCLVGAVLGAAAAFGLARGIAAEPVSRVGDPRLLRARDWIDEHGFVAVLYTRILPLPFPLMSYLSGLAKVRLAPFVAATALGTAPRAYAYTALGGNIDNLSSPQAYVPVLVLVALFAAATASLSRRGSVGQR